MDKNSEISNNNEEILEIFGKLIFVVKTIEELDFVIQRFNFEKMKKIEFPYILYVDNHANTINLSGTTETNIAAMRLDEYFIERGYRITSINMLKVLIEEKEKEIKIETLSKEYNYFSPNVKNVIVLDDKVIFETVRFQGEDDILSQTIFNKNTKEIIEITPYEKEYIIK